MPAEALKGLTDSTGGGHWGAVRAGGAAADGAGAWSAAAGGRNEKRSTWVGATWLGPVGSGGGPNGLDSADEEVNAEGAAEGGLLNGDGVDSIGLCGVGGISGSSVGAGAEAGRSTENTDWHLRQRTRAPCTGILSSAMT